MVDLKEPAPHRQEQSGIGRNYWSPEERRRKYADAISSGMHDSWDVSWQTFINRPAQYCIEVAEEEMQGLRAEVARLTQQVDGLMQAVANITSKGIDADNARCVAEARAKAAEGELREVEQLRRCIRYHNEFHGWNATNACDGSKTCWCDACTKGRAADEALKSAK